MAASSRRRQLLFGRNHLRQPPGSYCREVPDVYADAAPQTGAAIRFAGRWLSSGGTSLATPVWAAITALVDEYLQSNGDHPVGFANPLLYRLARSSLGGLPCPVAEQPLRAGVGPARRPRPPTIVALRGAVAASRIVPVP